MKTTNETFRDAVEKWLVATNTPHENLAGLIGCSPSSLYKYLKGETSNIPLERAVAISSVIGYEIEVD